MGYQRQRRVETAVVAASSVVVDRQVLEPVAGGVGGGGGSGFWCMSFIVVTMGIDTNLL